MSTGTETNVVAVNNSAEAVGLTTDFQEIEVWNGQTVVALDAAQKVFPTAINSAGTIIGYIGNSILLQATLWTDSHSAGMALPTGHSGFDQNSKAFGINTAGQVVGSINDPATQNDFAATWAPGTFAPSALPSDGAAASVAHAINTSGEIVGSSATPVIWQGTTITALEALSGPNADALALNDAGQIVGYATLSTMSPTTNTYISHAVTWTGTAHTIADLGALGGSVSQASAINAAGVIVGYSNLAGDAVSHATLWKNGTIVDLNTLLDPSDASHITLTAATGINDNGVICANGMDSQVLLLGQPTVFGYLLTPK